MNKILRPPLSGTFAILISLFPNYGIARATPKVAERNLGNIDRIVLGMLGEQDIAITFSPDDLHNAYWAAPDDHSYIYVVRDGVPGKHYDEVSENRRREIMTDDLVFSPDNKHLAYRAHRGEKWLVVVDGKESRLYDNVWTEGLHFSADSSRLAYRATRGKRDVFVIAEAATGRATHISKAPAYQDDAPTNSPATFLSPKIETVQQGDKWILMENGRQLGASYDYIAGTAVSPDRHHVAYQAKKGDRWCMVVDGTEGAFYDSLHVGDVPLYSADSKHLVYAVGQKVGSNQQWSIIVDGKSSRAYDGVYNIAVSPDSRHVMFWGERDKSRYINVDGAEFGPYESYGGPTREFQFRGPADCSTVAMRGDEALRLRITFDDK